MIEFDDMFTAKALGLRDHTEYCGLCEIDDKIDGERAPMLIVAADDDRLQSGASSPGSRGPEREGVNGRVHGRPT